MADGPNAAVLEVITRRNENHAPANRKEFQSWKMIFLGNTGDGLKSGPIEKISLLVSDFHWTPFAVAAEMTFEVGQEAGGPFVLHPDLVVDLTAKNVFNTAILAGYAYYKIIIDAAEANTVFVGHV